MRRLPVVDSRMAVYEPAPVVPPGFGADGLPPLVDARGRTYRYLRLSVTDRCDLACVYCMPPSGEEEHSTRNELLSFEEATRLVSIVSRMGIRRVRLTGGEPLVRRDVVQLVERIRRDTAIESLVMTTNATRLAELARPLADAGLSGVNVSIDTLDATKFRAVTRGGELGSVIAGLRAAIDVGLEVKLNTVALRGTNDDEIETIVDYAWSLGVVPRFIELMPLGEAANLPASTRLTADEIRARLAHRISEERLAKEGDRGPARYLAASDGSGRKVGFITPISDEFCGDCSRIRVNARGDLRACLASRRALSLRDAMRSGRSDAEVGYLLQAALLGKGVGHEFLDATATEHEHVGMSLIGG